MYQLQILFHNQGNWENTVYQPMEYNKVQKLLRSCRLQYDGVHSYRVVNVG